MELPISPPAANDTHVNVLSNDDDQFLPGPYNLLEDADLYNNAFYRPTKQFSLGKI